MDTYDHFGYCEWVARHLSAVRHSDGDCHFLRGDETDDISDLEARISGLHGFVLVAIDGHNSDFAWANGDSLVDIPQYFAAILRQADAGDPDALHGVKRECRDILEQVMCRLMADRDDGLRGLHALDPDSMTMRGVGPIGDNYCGVMLRFNLRKPVSFRVNPLMWT